MSSKTVLLVDDEPDILKLLEITLARMNIATRRAETLQQAKAVLGDIIPDLCLTDMKLPTATGCRYFATCKSISPMYRSP